MSHSRERTSNDCLNCGTLVQGRYCHVCGQENIETKESFWSLTKHFVFDILHFDGKFWLTLRRLCTQPGRVAKDYVSGKRVPYVHPIRMYLFTSAVFFLFFFSFDAVKFKKSSHDAYLTPSDQEEYIEMYEERMTMVPADSFLRQRIALLQDTTKRLNIDSLGWNQKGQRFLSYERKHYRSVAEYDSVQKTLSAAEKKGWFRRLIARRQLEIEEKYEGEDEALRGVIDLFLHRIPYMLFVSLPFFAGILKLLYRRRRQFAYSDHAVFTLYHYVISFLLLIFTFLIEKLSDVTDSKLWNILQVVAIVGWYVYLYLEMKRFYGQGRGKTFAKFTLLNILGGVLILMLFVVFLLLSFLF